MTDLDARAERVREIAKSLFGRVLDRGVMEFAELIDDEVHERHIEIMEIEVPADMAGPCASMLGQGGFSGYIIGQDARMAPRRVTDMSGRTVVCLEQDLMAFYKWRVELSRRAVAVETAPNAAIAITRQTKPGP